MNAPASRIALLDRDEARKAAAEEGIAEGLADLNVFRVLLHHPPLARWFADFLMGLLWEGRFDARLRELVIMRLGWATGSVYEWTQHWRIALQLGCTEDDVLGVRDWQHHDGFGPAEQAVLAAVDETLADGAVSEATWDACVEHVSPEPRILLEMVSAIGLWRMVSTVLRSVEIPLEDGVEAWPPDGAVPGGS